MKNILAMVCIVAFCLSGTTVLADEITREINVFHYKLVIKHRARSGTERQNGRVVYQYNRIRNYAEEQAGNIEADSSVRKIYNYTIVTDPLIQAFASPVEIGNITAEGKTTEVVNIVNVEGNIKSFFQPVSIGNLKLNLEQGGQVKNRVRIKGSIYAQ